MLAVVSVGYQYQYNCNGRIWVLMMLKLYRSTFCGVLILCGLHNQLATGLISPSGCNWSKSNQHVNSGQSEVHALPLEVASRTQWPLFMALFLLFLFLTPSLFFLKVVLGFWNLYNKNKSLWGVSFIQTWVLIISFHIDEGTWGTDLHECDTGSKDPNYHE